MRGYCYLDLDGQLIYKPAEYIDSDNPFFFNQNSHLIIRKWQFDTDNLTSMENMFRNFSDLKLNASSVLVFCQSIDFHPSQFKELKENAGKV